MKYEIRYIPLNPALEGGAQGPYSGRSVSADSPSQAVIAFAQEISDIHPDRKVAVSKDKVGLNDEDIYLLNQQGIEYRNGINPPYIEVIAINEVK